MKCFHSDILSHYILKEPYQTIENEDDSRPSENLTTILRAIDELKQNQKQAFTLVYLDKIAQQEAAEIEKAMPVISKRLFAGQTIIHVMAPSAPDGFETTPANLEDVYFSTLHSHRSAA